MNGSLYIGATGMKTQAEGLNVVSNNIANVNTLGFKQQSMLFADLMYQGQGNAGGSWGSEQGSFVATGQVGMGSQVDSVRTLFKQGNYEMGNDVTDLAIMGKGFFEVTTPNGDTRYTRAGNYRFDKEGFLKLPDGSTLSGYALDKEGARADKAGPVRINPMLGLEAQATSRLEMGFNIGVTEDRSASDTDPYFGLVQAFNSTGTPPLQPSSYGYSQGIQVYDDKGQMQELTVYFDGTPATGSGKTVEFLVAKNAVAPDAGGQALMTGTLTFTADGQLQDMSAFVPTSGETANLNNWAPAQVKDGLPQLTLGEQSISLNMGLVAAGEWTQAPGTAAEVGLDRQKLPSMGVDATRDTKIATTAFSGSSALRYNVQDGYGEGKLNRLEVEKDGKVVASFTNGQTRAVYEIPVCRFTSEDGLRREGGNLFSRTTAAGDMEMGMAGSENFGLIEANSLEGSNVDMAREMVNMISTQRGFQSNSKVVTTADALLQRAIEMKR